jgi:pimeloyl-ACP methyl ester carboxylesterase
MRRDWDERGVTEIVNARTKQVMRISRDVLDDFEKNRERFDIVNAAESLRVPLLVVHGGRDESVPVASGKLLAAHARDASLLVIHNAGHTFNAIHPLVHVPFELAFAAEASAHFIAAHV